MTEQEQARVEEVKEGIARTIWNISYWSLLASQRKKVNQALNIKDKDGKLMLGIISDDQKCKIQRIGAEKIVTTTFDTEYTGKEIIRRVIIVE